MKFPPFQDGFDTLFEIHGNMKYGLDDSGKGELTCSCVHEKMNHGNANMSSKAELIRSIKPLSLRMPLPLREQLEKVAEKERRSLSAQALMYIEQGIQKTLNSQPQQ